MPSWVGGVIDNTVQGLSDKLRVAAHHRDEKRFLRIEVAIERTSRYTGLGKNIGDHYLRVAINCYHFDRRIHQELPLGIAIEPPWSPSRGGMCRAGIERQPPHQILVRLSQPDDILPRARFDRCCKRSAEFGQQHATRDRASAVRHGPNFRDAWDLGAPASPRNCKTASWRYPYPCSRPPGSWPPWVFTGSSPSRAMDAPPSMKGPLSPRPQDPSASSHDMVSQLKPSYSSATSTSAERRSVRDHM
jgi:hypothetical protein